MNDYTYLVEPNPYVDGWTYTCYLDNISFSSHNISLTRWGAHLAARHRIRKHYRQSQRKSVDRHKKVSYDPSKRGGLHF